MRVAMKVGTTLSYLLGDHGVCACANTGSTSITTNNAGTKTAVLRYRAVANNALHYSLKKSHFAGFPGVETRYSSGTTPTTFHITCLRVRKQRPREQSEIGLYFYNARRYYAAHIIALACLVVDIIWS
jgi:uncharacterized protein (DUF433 family)